MKNIRIQGNLIASGMNMVGFLVRIQDKKSQRTLLEGVSVMNGEFKLKTSSIKEIQSLQNSKNLEIQVFGKSDTVITSNEINIKKLLAKNLKLKIPKDTANKAQPKFELLERVSGNIFDLEKIDVFWTAMKMSYPQGNPAQMPFSFGSICPLPDIKHVPDLVDVAWQVIEGDPRAKIQMRETLATLRHHGKKQSDNIFNEIAREIRSDENSFKYNESSNVSSRFMSFQNSFSQENLGSPLPLQRPCFLTQERFLPVAAATILTASSQTEMFSLLGSLENGLCGLGRVNNILEAATTVVNGGFDGRFKGLVGLRWGEATCGPDDGPIPVDPFPDNPDPGCDPFPTRPDLDWCFHERLDCIRELIDALANQGSASENPYIIERIIPPSGCPDDEIVLEGQHFGENPGKVRFTDIRSGTLIVDAISWSDTKIRVRVPEHTGNGLVSLKILESSQVVCNTIIPKFRTGTGHNFQADTAAINSLRINGSSSTQTVIPGQALTINWSATHDNVSLRILNASGTSVYSRTNLNAAGTRTDFVIPNATTQNTYTLEATVTASCGTATLVRNFTTNVSPTITIEGMEVTQGVQRFRRSGVLDNSLRTVANKDTIVRVYISCDRNGFLNDQEEVSGILHVDGQPHYPINGSSPDSSSNNPDPFITARRNDLIDRQITDHTLNFRIPASRCNGTKNIRVRVFSDPVVGPVVSDSATQPHTWTTNGVLKVRYVRIRDDSQSPSTPRPSSNECIFTIERGLDLMPTALTDIGPAWKATWNTSKDFRGDDDDLSDLLNDINDEHNCNAWEWLWGWSGATDCPDDDHAIWVAISSLFNRGMGKRPGNTCVSARYQISSGQGATLRIKTAHEIGHNLSMKHIDRGGAGGSFYDHPNNGDLLDIPFDPFWNVTVQQSSVRDFMGYGAPRWSSADSWNRMFNFI